MSDPLDRLTPERRAVAEAILAASEPIGVEALVKLVPSSAGSIRQMFAPLIKAGLIKRAGRGKYWRPTDDSSVSPRRELRARADASAETRIDIEDLDGGDLIEIPTAPYGHAASFDVVVDNTDGGIGKSYFQEATLRAMLGGAEIPRDADGRIALRFSFAVGDSMAPFIPDGQPFIYRVGGGFVDGARYALWLGSTQADVIKRVEVQGGGVVHLRSDNSNIRTKVLQTGEEPGTWLDEAGRMYELEIRGQVVWPLDTPAAVVGQITDRLTQLAMSALRG
jgi:hypothetical protein